MAEHVKPLKGFDSGIVEIVLRHRGDALSDCGLFRLARLAVRGEKLREDTGEHGEVFWLFLVGAALFPISHDDRAVVGLEFVPQPF